MKNLVRAISVLAVTLVVSLHCSLAEALTVSVLEGPTGSVDIDGTLYSFSVGTGFGNPGSPFEPNPIIGYAGSVDVFSIDLLSNYRPGTLVYFDPPSSSDFFIHDLSGANIDSLLIPVQPGLPDGTQLEVIVDGGEQSVTVGDPTPLTFGPTSEIEITGFSSPLDITFALGFDGPGQNVIETSHLPEPGSFALLGIGIAAIAGYSLKRKRHVSAVSKT